MDGDWTAVAVDRQKWKSLENTWVFKHDVPWTSGRQLALPPWQHAHCQPVHSPHAIMDRN